VPKRRKLKDPANPRALRPKPGDATRVLELSKDGFSVDAIARRLGISPDTFLRWRDDYPELADALAEGRVREHQVLYNTLFQAAQGGNIVAAMFLLKARHGYREGDQGELANRVSINFQLPGALPLEQFRVIEHEPNRADALPAQVPPPARRG
jgi:hypothetical protein